METLEKIYLINGFILLILVGLYLIKNGIGISFT